MNKYHAIEAVTVEDTTLVIRIGGHEYRIDLSKESQKLASATQDQLEDFIISPSGYGIHWPQIDEDLAIDPLIGIQHEIPAWKVADSTSEYKTKKDEL